MPVEEAGGGHEAHRVDRTVEVGHRSSPLLGGVIPPGYYDVVLNWPEAGPRWWSLGPYGCGNGVSTQEILVCITGWGMGCCPVK